MDDRTEMDLGPGDAYVIEPGHNGWVVGDEPYVAIDVSTETVEKFAKEEEEEEEEEEGMVVKTTLGAALRVAAGPHAHVYGKDVR